MGKAAVDLPDPLQSPPDAGRPLTSTDDLLAQLAGEEIDRLLAEVDDTPSSSPAVTPAATPAAPLPPALAAALPVSSPPPSVPSGPAPSLADLDVAAASPLPADVAELHDAAPILDETEAKAVLARNSADLTEELDALFSAARLAPHPDPSAAAAPGIEQSHETTVAERAGLAAHASEARIQAPSAKAAPSVAAAADEEAEPGPLPLYLRPLEWINAPLESCPAPVRDFVGKAAIVTLVNAAAILLYVMLFRRA